MWRSLSITAALVLALDQITKYWIVEALDLRHLGRLEVLPPLLNLRMAWNPGVNFGLLNFGDDGRWALIALALALCIGLLWWAAKAKGPFLGTATGLVIGGALGNAIDRARHGAVADFLNMSCCGFDNPFSFNVADIAVFFGAITLVLFAKRPEKHR